MRRQSGPETHVWPRVVEMCDPVVQDELKMSLVKGIKKSNHSRRRVPPKGSQNEFAVGALRGVHNTHPPMALPCCPWRKCCRDRERGIGTHARRVVPRGIVASSIPPSVGGHIVTDDSAGA